MKISPLHSAVNLWGHKEMGVQRIETPSDINYWLQYKYRTRCGKIPLGRSLASRQQRAGRTQVPEPSRPPGMVFTDFILVLFEGVRVGS
jgi:hypothetical protein